MPTEVIENLPPSFPNVSQQLPVTLELWQQNFLRPQWKTRTAQSSLASIYFPAGICKVSLYLMSSICLKHSRLDFSVFGSLTVAVPWAVRRSRFSVRTTSTPKSTMFMSRIRPIVKAVIGFTDSPRRTGPSGTTAGRDRGIEITRNMAVSNLATWVVTFPTTRSKRRVKETD